MQNETIDKLKNAGYITVTDDSQGIADKVGISGGSGINKLDIPHNFQLSFGKVSDSYDFQSQSQSAEGIIEEYNEFLEETSTTLGISVSQLNDIINGNVDRLMNHCVQEVGGDLFNYTTMSKLDDIQYYTITYANPETPVPGITTTEECRLNTTYTGLFLGMSGGEISEPLYTSNIIASAISMNAEGYKTPIVTQCSIRFALNPLEA